MELPLASPPLGQGGAATTTFHLPALPEVAVGTRAVGSGPGSAILAFAQLTPDQLRHQLLALGEARDACLARRPLEQIVSAVDRVAGRLLDPTDPLRRTAESILPAATGFSRPMVCLILDRMAADWRADRLWGLLRSEFGDPAVLDRWMPRTQGDASSKMRAFGPRLTVHIASGNVPGVAVTSLVRALLLRSASLLKTGADDPVLPVLFARALAEADPELGRCIAVTHWAGGDEPLEHIAFAAADAVIAYGGDAAIQAVRARVPAHVRFLGYGHKVSFGMVGREALGRDEAAEWAERAARDVATFDQGGCVSPHLFYAEEGGEVTPREWARLLAEALDRLHAELPPGTMDPAVSAAVRQAAAEAEFAGFAAPANELHLAADGVGWAVIHDPDSEFRASCLGRLVRVHPVPDLAEVAGRVGRYGPLLQTVGMAVGEPRAEELAVRLGELGASRIAPLGRMAWPPPAWHHDGRPPLRALVRWCDLEES